ncbi:Uncharacterised protein [Escherichia coli]|uniref:Uncharacterized protein n=1 Tax=Escherichia coli TaxID=562 RepID=A0A376W0J4_ECOLX|nr:Uncharacterised protein [Escherichia coli]
MISRWKWMLKQTIKKTMVQGNVIRNCRDNNGPFINSF